MRRVACPLSIVALGLLLFLAWMHPAVLRPDNVGWLLAGEDRGQSAIGLAAYFRAGGPWPGLHEPLLDAPEGLTLLFTDSIPLLGLLLKPVAFLIPPGAQFIGPWYLVCCLLQAGFAAALVRRYAPEAAAAWCGAAVLALMPALLNRYGHASLCAQWLLLWALWVFVEPARARSPRWWAAVLAMAALVHSYLLLMTLAIGAAALLERLTRPGRGRALAGAALAVLPAILILAAEGAFGGPYASTHTYGAFPAALDAWWNVANPDYAALIPSSPRAPDGRGFEGLNYLGAGSLALLALMVGRLAAGAIDATGRATLRRLLWLVLPLLPLALLAYGPAPLWRGTPVFVTHLAPWLIDALDPVRAAGRLLWPATYALALAGVIAAARAPRALLVLAGALTLQVIDLTPMLAATRHTSAVAEDSRRFRRTLDPRWTALVAGADAIEFEPPTNFVDLGTTQEVAWRAVVACRPVRFSYASREARATRARINADSRAFAAGRLDPARLYVLLGPTPAPPATLGRVRTLDGIRLIPPARPAPPPACASSPRSAS